MNMQNPGFQGHGPGMMNPGMGMGRSIPGSGQQYQGPGGNFHGNPGMQSQFPMQQQQQQQSSMFNQQQQQQLQNMRAQQQQQQQSQMMQMPSAYMNNDHVSASFGGGRGSPVPGMGMGMGMGVTSYSDYPDQRLGMSGTGTQSQAFVQQQHQQRLFLQQQQQLQQQSMVGRDPMMMQHLSSRSYDSMRMQMDAQGMRDSTSAISGAGGFGNNHPGMGVGPAGSIMNRSQSGRDMTLESYDSFDNFDTAAAVGGYGRFDGGGVRGGQGGPGPGLAGQNSAIRGGPVPIPAPGSGLSGSSSNPSPQGAYGGGMEDGGAYGYQVKAPMPIPPPHTASNLRAQSMDAPMPTGQSKPQETVGTTWVYHAVMEAVGNVQEHHAVPIIVYV